MQQKVAMHRLLVMPLKPSFDRRTAGKISSAVCARAVWSTLWPARPPSRHPALWGGRRLSTCSLGHCKDCHLLLLLSKSCSSKDNLFVEEVTLRERASSRNCRVPSVSLREERLAWWGSVDNAQWRHWCVCVCGGLLRINLSARLL